MRSRLCLVLFVLSLALDSVVARDKRLKCEGIYCNKENTLYVEICKNEFVYVRCVAYGLAPLHTICRGNTITNEYLQSYAFYNQHRGKGNGKFDCPDNFDSAVILNKKIKFKCRHGRIIRIEDFAKNRKKKGCRLVRVHRVETIESENLLYWVNEVKSSHYYLEPYASDTCVR